MCTIDALYWIAIQALEDGRKEAVQEIVKENPLILQVVDGYGCGNTLLHHACDVRASPDIIQYLAEQCVVSCLQLNSDHMIPLDIVVYQKKQVQLANKRFDANDAIEKFLAEITTTAVCALIDVICHRSSCYAVEEARIEDNNKAQTVWSNNIREEASMSEIMLVDQKWNEVPDWLKEKELQALLHKDEAFGSLVKGIWNMNQLGRKELLSGYTGGNKGNRTAVWTAAREDLGCLFIHILDSPIQHLELLSNGIY